MAESHEIHEDILPQIEKYQKAAPQISDVVYASQKAFQLLEPWLAASSEDERLQAVLYKIRDHVRQHCETLNLSAKAAESGWFMADNAVTVFKELINGKASADVIQEAMALLSEDSGQVSDSVRSVLTALRSDRTKLLSVMKELQDTREVVEMEMNGHKSAILHDKKTRTQAPGAALGLVGTVNRRMKNRPKSISYLVVSLPLALPVMDLQIDFSDEKGRKQIQERGHKYQSCGQAIKQLEDGIAHIKILEQHLTSLIEYWSKLKLVVDQISNRLGALQKNPRSRLLFQDLHGKYQGLREDFLGYKLGVERLQDYTRAQSA